MKGKFLIFFFLFFPLLGGSCVFGQVTSKPAVYSSMNISYPAVALTFDDGPHPEYTPKILDILKAYGVRATFFVLGQRVKQYPQIAQRIVSEGHQIANHSYNHPSFTKLRQEKLDRQVVDTSAIIKAYTGVVPTAIRPPYGALNDKVLVSLLEKHRLNVILWNVDPQDWRKPGSEVIAQRVLETTKPGSVILLHDIHKQTVDSLPTILTGLLSQRYVFGTVNQLLGIAQNSEVSVGSLGNLVANPNSLGSRGAALGGHAQIDSPSLASLPSLPAGTASGAYGLPVEKPLAAPPGVVHGRAVPVMRAMPVSP